MSGVLALGRPKKRKDDSPQKTLVSLKGNPEWADWLRDFAESEGVPVTVLIDLALREKAARSKVFKRPMPRRF